MTISRYLESEINLSIGCVDDHGDANYLRLDQNVPDGYVCDLQSDLLKLGFTVLEEADGAFGEKTGNAVSQFQRLAKIPANGIVDQTTKNEIRIWVTHGYTKNSPPSTELTGSTSTVKGIKFISPRVPHFSQGDERWASKILGHHSTIKKRGCAITCVAMILSYFGRHVTPETLDSYLDQEGGYVGDNVVWSVAGKCGETPQNRLKYFSKKGDEQDLHTHLIERIGQNKPTMARVDYGVDPDIRYNHFVVCVGLSDQSGFVMNDPATRLGDGYADPGDDNIIQNTSRKNGYSIVQLDWYDPVT